MDENADRYEDDQIDSEEIDNDPVVCDICLDGEVYEDNEILFCDKCDIPVHQSCYGVEHVPEGAWYCYVCSNNLNTSDISCELCPYKGGAFKYTNELGKWVHGLCACWIPEVYEVYPLQSSESSVYINLSRLQMERYKLKCVICSKKGACVQCAYGRCTTAVHPWCALKDSTAGFTRRIIKNDEGNMLWEIFCKTHAKAVADPVKYKRKKGTNPRSDHVTDQNSVNDMRDLYWQDGEGTDSCSPLPVENNEVVTGSTLGNAVEKFSITSMSKSSVDPNLTAIVSLLEWPGINEGDAMDLDHFWNYISSFYVEDHSYHWLDWLQKSLPTFNLLNHSLPSTPSNQQVEEYLDLLSSNFTHERDRAQLFTYQKREMFLREINEIVNLLSQYPISNPEGCSMFSISSNEVDFLTSDYDVESKVHFKIAEIEKDNIEVVFNGEPRIHGSFSVQLPSSEFDSNDPIFRTEISNYIYPVDHHSAGRNTRAQSTLLSMTTVNDSSNIYLSNGKVLIPKFEDDELSRVIYCSERAEEALVGVIKSKIDDVFSKSDVHSMCGSNMKFLLESKTKYTSYTKQQIWKKISSSLFRGFRDNITLTSNEEDLPPSWKIATEGRPGADADDEAEPHEDAVCMCCFDGTSTENNRIIFCDGCNCAVHQLCYGVPEIPEGDYYCDRCRSMQLLSHEMADDLDEYTLKNSIRCCLCPLHHGGLKPSSDGRWVHMCCFFMTQTGLIEDLREIPTVDISGVRVQSIGTMSCQICGRNSGYLTKCGFSSSDHNCNKAFHPICAWFAGLDVSIDIADLSLEHLETLKYPSGITVSLTCEHHAVQKKPDQKSVLELKKLRSRYRINERDLEIFPGDNKRKRNKYRRKNSVAPSRQATSLKSAPRELPVDVYNPDLCCLCFSSTNANCIKKEKFYDELLNSRSIISDVDDDLVELANKYIPKNMATSAVLNIPLQCSKCKIVVHSECLAPLHQRYQFSTTQNLCSVCAQSDHNNITCSLCPRKGGLLVQSSDSSWVHLFCAQSIPALIKWLPSGELDYKLVSKDCKKQKCSICNRKVGMCVQCCEVGCGQYFHPLCIAKSGLGVIRSRGSNGEFFCRDHIPSRLQQSHLGYWVDGYELQMLRHSFDRARLVLDLVIKREKLKKSVFKINGEIFDTKFQKLLNASKGGNIESKEDELSDNDSTISMEDELANKFVSLDQLNAKYPRNQTISVQLENQTTAEISGLWHDGRNFRIPKMNVAYCCIEISKNETICDGGRRGFCNLQRTFAENELYKKRGSLLIFPTRAQELSFQKTLPPHIQDVVNLPNQEFVDFMEEYQFLGPVLSVKELNEPEKKKRKIRGSDEFNVASKVSKTDNHNELEDLRQYMQDHQCVSILEGNNKTQEDIATTPTGFQQHFLNVTSSLNANLDFWKVYPAEELVELERLLMDVLNFINQQHLDSENSVCKDLTNRIGIVEEEAVKDFESIPYEIIPNYNALVRRTVCLKDIRNRLHDHEYTSVAAFAHDFFQMLNNARNITDSSSKIWQDTQTLGELFGELIKILQSFPMCVQPRSKNSRFEIIKANKNSSAQNGKRLSCSKCDGKFIGINWPKSFTGETEETKIKVNKRHEQNSYAWCWFCPNCIKAFGERLINERVQVWWEDDATAYFGIINAFDRNSQCHRILYDDAEWEFINLGAEPLYVKHSESLVGISKL